MLGINPHTGDKGVIGEEDDTVSCDQPLKEIYDQRHPGFWPLCCRQFLWDRPASIKFDAVLATYHDQGLNPVQNT